MAGISVEWSSVGVGIGDGFEGCWFGGFEVSGDFWVQGFG